MRGRDARGAHLHRGACTGKQLPLHSWAGKWFEPGTLVLAELTRTCLAVSDCCQAVDWQQEPETERGAASPPLADL